MFRFGTSALFAGLVIVGWLVSGSAMAADASKVRGVIADHCVACHEVPGFDNSKRAEASKAPAFQVIADNPDKYPDVQIRQFLQKPHFPMQKFNLSKTDIDNLATFIGDLR